MRDVVLVIVHADETGVERHARAVDDGGVLGHGCDPDNDGRDRLVVDEDRHALLRRRAGAVDDAHVGDGEFEPAPPSRPAGPIPA